MRGLYFPCVVVKVVLYARAEWIDADEGFKTIYNIGLKTFIDL